LLWDYTSTDGPRRPLKISTKSFFAKDVPLSIAVPRQEDHSPEYAAAIELTKKLSGDVASLRTEARRQFTIASQSIDNGRAARAEAIAQGTTPDASLDSPQIDATVSRLRDTELALELSQAKLRQIKIREDRRLCTELKPAWDTLARQLASQLVDLHSTLLTMSQLKSDLMQQDIGFYPIICSLDIENVFESPRDRTSDFARLLRECIEHGYLKQLPHGLN
jgi:hypothetical protein